MKKIRKWNVILRLDSFAQVEVEAATKEEAGDMALAMDHSGQVDFGEQESSVVEVRLMFPKKED